MDERRRFDRVVLNYYSPVYDLENGTMLGYLWDLTTGGALLVGDFPLKVNEVFRLRLELPENFAEKDHLVFEAKAMWTRPDTTSEYHHTGLRFLNIKPMDLFILERLMADYGVSPRRERSQEAS